MPLGPSWSLRPMASHKVEPLTKSKSRKVPDVPLFDDVEEPEDESGPFVITPEIRDNPHPTDLPEGMLEKLVKYAANMGGSHADDDRIFLEQYLHPERDIIPKQPLRPTKGGMGPSDNMEYRRLPEVEVGDRSYPMDDGLGNYTRSSGDKYNSAYDVWDFDTNTPLAAVGEDSPLKSAANWVAKKVMQNVGTPFKVYERYNKDRLPPGFDPDYMNPKSSNYGQLPSDDWHNNKPLDEYPSYDESKWDENNEYIPLKKKKEKGKR